MIDRPPALVAKGLTIAPELFTRGYPLGGGPCSCTSACCERGVYADTRERERILARSGLILRHMDETQPHDPQRWFETEEYEDPDFPSGRCVGTAVVNGRCAFLDSEGRCSIQVATMAEGLGRWALKPLYCILYPLEISDGVVNFDPMLQEERSCCTARTSFDIPLFEACADELEHILGSDGMQAIRDHYQRYYQPNRKAV